MSWAVAAEDGTVVGFFGDRDDAVRYAEAMTFRTDGNPVYHAMEAEPLPECSNCGSIIYTTPYVDPEQASWLGTDTPVWCDPSCMADAGEQAQAGTPG